MKNIHDLLLLSIAIIALWAGVIYITDLLYKIYDKPACKGTLVTDYQTEKPHYLCIEELR